MKKNNVKSCGMPSDKFMETAFYILIVVFILGFIATSIIWFLKDEPTIDWKCNNRTYENLSYNERKECEILWEKK